MRFPFVMSITVSERAVEQLATTILVPSLLILTPQQQLSTIATIPHLYKFAQYAIINPFQFDDVPPKP
ncbi:hypothetical protein FGO68_gene841 [Halteria grandinella]|uniref:Uncharacterized protein n=1 Tax=Halteria grandinella TaxID=5974 RepID=A0A8J8T917_HALGN|nr:hypothetical protein FGO68_gene841 [Halteria grandinella]